MSIDKETLKSDIKAILDEQKLIESDQQSAIDSFADALADKISDAIKRGIDTATVTHILIAGSTAVTGTITLTAEK
jgi:hypothetical protein